MRAIANVFIEKISRIRLRPQSLACNGAVCQARRPICVAKALTICRMPRSSNHFVGHSATTTSNSLKHGAGRFRHPPFQCAGSHQALGQRHLGGRRCSRQDDDVIMLGQVFEECRQDHHRWRSRLTCSISILGKGQYVIAGSQKNGTFLKQHPYIAVITNIDADHMDHYNS